MFVSPKENCPVIIGASAKRNTIKLLASFIRLSLYRIVTSLLCVLMVCKIEVAATASGGETMPPNKKLQQL